MSLRSGVGEGEERKGGGDLKELYPRYFLKFLSTSLKMKLFRNE